MDTAETPKTETETPAPETKSVPVRVKVKGKEVIGHALKSDVRKMKPKKKAKPQAKKAKATKPAAKPKRKPVKKVKAKRANLSLIDLDKLKALIKVKGGSTVPKLMKALRQPRINVARAIDRLKKLVKIKAVRAPHVEKVPGQRPFVYTLA